MESAFADAEQRMTEKLNERKASNSLRSLIPSLPHQIDFCSNDYLGLARSPELRREVEQEWHKLKISGINQVLGSGGSRLLAGDSEYAQQLEKELADFYKSEAVLLFNSGYTANLSLFSAIPKRGDTILFDELSHASVRDGIRMSSAKSWSFRHNDVDHLEELLKKAEGTIFVSAESVYSMDGDECPLEAIVALCEKYKAALILDEAHSNGLYGKDGEGIAVDKDLHTKIFARLLTFGKAAGCHGAAVAGSKTLRDYLVNFARPFIYTTALPLHDLAVIKCAVRNFSGKGELRQQLFSFVNYFREKAADFPALQIMPSKSAIQGILVPGNKNVRAMAEKCKAGNMDIRAILSPTVQEGQERLRLVVHAFNHPLEIDELLKTISGTI